VRSLAPAADARVVEDEASGFAQADPDRLEVAALERRLLVLIVARDDQRVVVDHGELVQHAQVRIADGAHDELGSAGRNGLR
jgi:hypothetical protein